MPDTCDRADVTAVCNGPVGCKWNSDRCLVTPFSSVCGESHFVEISKQICNSSNPIQCAELQGVFAYNKGWPEGECGVVGNSTCASGKEFVSGDPVYHAFCAACDEGLCRGMQRSNIL